MMNTKVNQVTIEMYNELLARIEVLEKRVERPEVKEMTDDHAFDVTYGQHKDLKHKAAAELLGLTYGQIYSCRLEFTFKDVHKKASADGKKNDWKK
jgi:hypothetical protein